MAVNRGAAKRDSRSARQDTETSTTIGTGPAGLVSHEELLLHTSLGTIGNSSHGVTSSLFTNNHSTLSWPSEVSSESVSPINAPIQVETSPPDSQEVVGKTNATVTGFQFRSNTVPHCGATSAASKVVQDAAIPR